MKTFHFIQYNNANNLEKTESYKVQLVVTSPPYPMIEMWDEIFASLNSEVQFALNSEDGETAFELMHKELDKIWEQAYRVLSPGGILCINIGDATRKIGETFQLFSNHSRILNSCLDIGFHNLPNILWRKQTNAPNKFMGSGMLPPGAYVTLEHEYILVLRKDQKREFKEAEEKDRRNESAYFWEERNNWFSDIWYDLKGTQQDLHHSELRERSGAFPFELAYRLINMYSVKHDTVLDPFLGTGTTTIAAMASERNSIGYEIDSNFQEVIEERIQRGVPFANNVIHQRLYNHLQFVEQRRNAGKDFKNRNDHYGFPCISKQESSLLIKDLDDIAQTGNNTYEVSFIDTPQQEFCLQDSEIDSEALSGLDLKLQEESDPSNQGSLFE